MPEHTKIDAREFLGRWALIVGDVNSGKTTYTQRILDRIAQQIDNDRLAVIDLAPVIPEEMALKFGLRGIGGRLRLAKKMKKGLYLSTHIDPPRLSTDTEEAALAVAEKNRTKIEHLLQTFSKSKRDVLFVNDISLYLQAGRALDLIRFFNGITTIVANGYWGEKLGQGVLSQREHKEMQTLMDSFSNVIRL